MVIYSTGPTLILSRYLHSLVPFIWYNGPDTLLCSTVFCEIIYLINAIELTWIDTNHRLSDHYSDVIMGTIASQITSLTIVYSIVHSDADQRKHQISGSLAFVWGIHRGPVNSPHKWPVTRKIFPFDDVIMYNIEMKCATEQEYEIHFNPVGSDIKGL